MYRTAINIICNFDGVIKIHFMKTKYFFSALLMVVSLSSFSQWSTDPSINNALGTVPGEEAIPKVATESGVTYVSWFSNEAGNYNVRLQKFDVYGNKLWAEGGILISDNQQETSLTDWDMTVDQQEHAILVWPDIRTGYNDIFAYRISPEGDFVWGEDGLQLSTGEAYDASPKVTVTNAGNAYFAWQAEDVIIGQKISPDGTLLWGPNGQTLSGANTYSWPQLLPVGEDDIILKFFEDSGPYWAPTRHVFAQRFDGTGNMVWPQPAIISDAGGITAWTQIFPFINDGNDGFFIAWHDDRDNNTLANMWVQHIGNDGSVLFPEDGVEVSTMPNRHHFYAQISLPEGSEDIFIFWNEMDANQNDRGIYGQKVSPDGTRLWTDNGKKFIEISSLNVYPLAGRSAGQDMVVFYEEYFNGVEGKVKAMRLDADGNYVWTPNMIDLCTVQSEKVHTEVSELNNGQWIAVWEDSRNGGRDIYGQNIKLDGTLGPIEEGELIITPDSVICEIHGPHYIDIINQTSDNVSITDVYFTYGWYIYFENSPVLPHTILPGDSLTIEFWVQMGSFEYNPEDYIFDYINIESSMSSYQVYIAINEDLIASVHSTGIENLKLSAFPIPFNDQISFEFNCDKITYAELTILNTQGSIVMTSGNLKCNAGTNTYQWNGKTNSGQVVPPGIYTYQLKLNNQIFSGRLVKIQ
jgi:hypothetical protein